MLLHVAQKLPVKRDGRFVSVNFHIRGGGRSAVHRHTAAFDYALELPARGNPHIRKIFIQPELCHILTSQVDTIIVSYFAPKLNSLY